jgi:hypothetical protein
MRRPRRHVGFVQILLQKSKIERPKNLAKVDPGASLLLHRLSAALRRLVIDFG